MSNHTKRLTVPGSWRIRRKANKFITKTAPGPHNASAMPVAVWLRDHMELARTKKEVRRILSDRSIIVNGVPCRDPAMGLGVFDIVSVPRMGKHYRILLDKRGYFVSIEIGEEAAKTRLCKVRNKTTQRGGKVQLNLRYGANVIADGSYKPRDSIVLSIDPEHRFEIVDHFPFAIGNVAMVIGGRHSGKVGRIMSVDPQMGRTPNRVHFEELATGEKYDTIEDYVFMVGREQPAVSEWGIE